MKRLLFLLTAFLVSLPLLAPPALAQEKPQHGGILTTFINADPSRLDFHSESGGQVVWATAGVFSGLLQHDPDDPRRVIGDLAHKWTVSPDGLVYTFHLRSGVKWHDDAPFTVADLKATFDRVLDPSFRSPRCGAALKPIVERFEVVDADTVRFRLKHPATTFISAISSVWCRIAAKHVLDKYGDLMRPEAQVGTGPFKFKRYERGNLIELERNPRYFVAGLPYLDGVKTFILKDLSTQLAATKSGKIMLFPVWPLLTKSYADEVRASRGEAAELTKVPMNIISTVMMNPARPPFDNPDIRRAVALAIDRQELVTKIFEGAGIACALLNPELAGDLALPASDLSALPGCRQPKDQDIAEARRLVAKHYPQGVDFEASVRTSGDYVDRAQVVLSQLRKIGLRGTLKSLESAVGWAAYAKGDFTFIATQDHGPQSANPADVFALLYSPTGGRNYSKWSDAKANDLMRQGVEVLNEDQRREIYRELQRYLLTQDTSVVIVGWPHAWFFKDKKVRNHRYPPSFYDDTTYTKVWLAR